MSSMTLTTSSRGFCQQKLGKNIFWAFSKYFLSYHFYIFCLEINKKKGIKLIAIECSIKINICRDNHIIISIMMLMCVLICPVWCRTRNSCVGVRPNHVFNRWEKEEEESTHYQCFKPFNHFIRWQKYALQSFAWFIAIDQSDQSSDLLVWMQALSSGGSSTCQIKYLHKLKCMLRTENERLVFAWISQ